jgi:segregation and condensation protein A
LTLAFAEDSLPEGQFLLDLDGFDGPIDLLLQLARDRKIDLTQLSIAELAGQYIAYIEHARHLRLEIAADYLVMAAWLAYLKSRLLLPQAETESDDPTPEEMAEALAFQLKRLEAMRHAAERLVNRDRLGSHVLMRGAPETFKPSGVPLVDLSLYQLLQAYSSCRHKADQPAHYQIAPLNLDSIEAALERLESVLGRLTDWSTLTQFLPSVVGEPVLKRRARLAAAFGASLELVKRGMLDLQQDKAFGPIYVRGRVQ